MTDPEFRPDARADGARMRAILVAAATIGFVTSPFWSPGFGGFDAAQFPIPQDDPPVQPAGYAFSIWSVIYLWLVVSAGYGLLSRAEDPGWDRVRWPLLVSLTLGIPWITVATLSPIWASILIWGMLASALTALFRAPGHDPWILRAPIALYAGWLTAASLVSLGLLGAGYGILMGAAAWAWAIVLAAIALGTALQTALPRTPFFGAAVAWALAAVAVRNAGQMPGLAVLAGLGAAALLLMSVRSARLPDYD